MSSAEAPSEFRVLVVKTSSLGDVVHTLPAVTDLSRQRPGVVIDWLVEEAFAEIPRLHPGISRVVSVAWRRWRRNLKQSLADGEIRRFRHDLGEEKYDVIVDAQGLVKSAIMSRMARGAVSGYDWQSSREGIASLAYHHRHDVRQSLHAIDRTRQLFAGVFGYELHDSPDYGLRRHPLRGEAREIMLLHGTTWPSKQWPVSAWRQLCGLIGESGYRALIPAGNREETDRAREISLGFSHAEQLPRQSLADLAARIANCAGVMTVDTGLGHLAAALGVPLVALYGPTDPTLTGVRAHYQETIVSDHLPCIPCRKRACRFANDVDSSRIYPPCFSLATPELTWQALLSQIAKATGSHA